MQIRIPEQQVDVLGQADVLVCGGGCGGVATAIAAARRGANVVLLERYPTVGGMSTNALVNGWHRSDRQKMVIFGLVEESAARCEKEGWISKDRSYPHAHETHWFDPEGMRITWQRMLGEAGVRTICHLTAGEPILDGDRIRGVLVDTKRGRRAVLGKIVIDCTGDGDIAFKSGAKWEMGREEDGRVQGMTLMFSLRDLDEPLLEQKPWADAERVVARMKQLRDAGEFPTFNEGGARASLAMCCAGYHHRFFWNMCPVAGNPIDEEELTKLSQEAREKILAYIKLWRQEMPGFAHAKLDQTGYSIGIRETRRIAGQKTLTEDMVLNAQKHEDAVGHGVWMVDIHDPKGSGHTTYTERNNKTMLKEGMSYHIPLGMALNPTIKNLAVACRGASTTHRALASFRVQTHIMTLAQGVGTAAAMALDSDRDMDAIDLRKLQSQLKAEGVYLEDVPARAMIHRGERWRMGH